jgi:hypothetical protein
MIVGSSIALADSGHYTAKLAQPVAAKKEVIANGNLWRCEGSDCVLVSEPLDATSDRSCHDLARKAGALTAYGTERKPFDSARLERCNRKD